MTQVTASGGRVTGIRGSVRGRPEVTETASLVIGADGKRSLVAGAVGARRYRERPVQSFASYSYWAGVPVSGGELYQRPGRAVAVFPTNDELTIVYAAAPMTEFASARADLEGHFLRTLDLCGDLGQRVRSGSRAERLRTTPDQPSTFRCPHGPGWALAGDAGVVMDSVSAQGMTNALRDASLLSAAVVAGLGGSGPLAGALHDHQRRRDRAIRGMYDFTVGLATFPRPRPASAVSSPPSPPTSTRPTGSSAPSPASCRRSSTSPRARRCASSAGGPSASSRQPACCPQSGWCRGQGCPADCRVETDEEDNSHRRQRGLSRDRARSSGRTGSLVADPMAVGRRVPGPARITGAALTAAGAAALLAAFAQFATQGRGTPAPPLPTEQLVVRGLYRYVRNPMYLAVLAVITGQALLLSRPVLLGYATMAGAAFIAFVYGYEQPTLARRYGAQYQAYQRAVPGWWPRLPPARKNPRP